MARRHDEGYTLTEILVAVAAVMILTSVALPQYNRAIELQHWRTAQDVLRTIYSGERAYFLLNNAYRDSDGNPGPGTWRDIYTDNPNLSGNPVVYSTATGPFTATATYNGTKAMSISETGAINFGSWPQP